MGCCSIKKIKSVAEISKVEKSNTAGIQPRQFIEMIRSSTPVEKVDQFNLYGRLDRCEMTTTVCIKDDDNYYNFFVCLVL